MPHYYSAEQTSPISIRKISASLRGENLEFFTGSGMFSPKAIDKGTELLISAAIVAKKSSVLDLGCGYGAFGIAIAKSFSECSVLLSDINKRAVDMAKRNIKLNNINNATVMQGNIFEPFSERKFDAIFINPPQAAGKDVCFQMIEESKDHLGKNCTLQIVARHNKGGKTLSKKMEEVFGNVSQTAKKSGYRVYMSTN